MKLSDCEIEHRYVRNTRLSFIFGGRALSADELRALMAEYTDAYGPVKLPAYVSPDGWQVFEATAEAAARPAAAEAATQEATAAPAAAAKPPKAGRAAGG